MKAETKICTGCGEDKPLSEYSGSRTYKKHSKCKACYARLNRIYYHKRKNEMGIDRNIGDRFQVGMIVCF